jgi:diguanylate cyclase (GGDEF)-like protein/PAS domain S-box-containing protein
MGFYFTLLALPIRTWLPLGLAALAPLVLGAVIVPLSRRRGRGIATVLTLRTVFVLGFGLVTLAGFATIAVVHTGLSELRRRHTNDVRTLAAALERSPLGPFAVDAQLKLGLFSAKDAGVAFVATGTANCRSACVLSVADERLDAAVVKARLIDAWPGTADREYTLTLGDRPYLLVPSPLNDAPGVAHGTVVAAFDAQYLADEATRTAWILLAISYLLLIIVGWSSWQQLSTSLASRIHAITTQLRTGSADDSHHMLEVDGLELRELAETVASYIKRNLDEQRSVDERYRRLVELSPDGVLICSTMGIQFANSAAIALAGVRNKSELIGSPIERFLEFDQASPAPAKHGKRRGDKENAVVAARPASWKKPDGTVLHVEVSEIEAGGGREESTRQFVIRDITHRRQREAALTHKAEHDSLTGLANRARFEAHLLTLLDPDRPAPTSGETRAVAVLFIDLDGFKPVNDSFGHAAGDAVLVAVGTRLKDSTRGTDFIGRLGGDEFAVLLEVRETEEVTVVAGRILRALRQPLMFDGAALLVGASVGIAISQRDGRESAGKNVAQRAADGARNAAELLRAADAAMYAAKAAGGDQFVIAGAIEESKPTVIAGALDQSPDREPGVRLRDVA